MNSSGRDKIPAAVAAMWVIFVCCAYYSQHAQKAAAMLKGLLAGFAH